MRGLTVTISPLPIPSISHCHPLRPLAQCLDSDIFGQAMPSSMATSTEQIPHTHGVMQRQTRSITRVYMMQPLHFIERRRHKCYNPLCEGATCLGRRFHPRLELLPGQDVLLCDVQRHEGEMQSLR